MEVKLIAFTCVGNEGDTPEPDQVCNLAARVCVSDEIPEMEYVDHRLRFWTDGDCKALKHAIQSGHESVAEHASFTFAISGVSRALTHQLVRHRIASFSQQSQRYVNMEDFDYIIPKSMSDKVIAKSIDPITLEPKEITLEMEYMNIIEDLHRAYKRLVDAGVPPEDARYILPNACCTNIIVTMNARELRHFFALRCCNRAQWEIRELANKMLELVKPIAPKLFENAGPSCVQLGYCPEKKSCGKCVTKDELMEYGKSYRILKKLAEE